MNVKKCQTGHLINVSILDVVRLSHLCSAWKLYRKSLFGQYGPLLQGSNGSPVRWSFTSWSSSSWPSSILNSNTLCSLYVHLRATLGCMKISLFTAQSSLFFFTRSFFSVRDMSHIFHPNAFITWTYECILLRWWNSSRGPSPSPRKPIWEKQKSNISHFCYTHKQWMRFIQINFRRGLKEKKTENNKLI